MLNPIYPPKARPTRTISSKHMLDWTHDSPPRPIPRNLWRITVCTLSTTPAIARQKLKKSPNDPKLNRETPPSDSRCLKAPSGNGTYTMIAANRTWMLTVILWSMCWPRGPAKHNREGAWSKSKSPTQIYRIRNQKWNCLEPTLRWKLQMRTYPWNLKHTIRLFRLLRSPSTWKWWLAITIRPNTDQTQTMPDINSRAPSRGVELRKKRVRLTNLWHTKMLSRRVICNIVVVFIIACLLPTIYATNTKLANQKLEMNTNFILKPPTRPLHVQRDQSTTHQINLRQQWSYFDQHQSKHPCLWSTMGSLGFKWSDDDIFAVWQSHPHYFNSLK